MPRSSTILSRTVSYTHLAGLGQNLTALHALTVDTTQQSADVVAGFSVVQQLVEHLDTGDDGLALLVGQTNDLNLLVELQLSTLHTAGSNGTTAGDGEHVLDEKRETVVTGIEMFHKLLDYAEAGDNIGALLRGVAKTAIERGQVLSKPGSIHPPTKFVGQVYVLTKDEGGRHTPFFNNYRPQFYFRTTDVTGIITLPEGTEMCMPGDNVDMNVELITPIAIENGLRFAIREGGRTVGSGVVIAINND